ncbi:hypothetical protein WA026_015643, partial [Henosepilachna vigintioctopunctata]
IIRHSHIYIAKYLYRDLALAKWRHDRRYLDTKIANHQSTVNKRDMNENNKNGSPDQLYAATIHE